MKQVANRALLSAWFKLSYWLISEKFLPSAIACCYPVQNLLYSSPLSGGGVLASGGWPGDGNRHKHSEYSVLRFRPFCLRFPVNSSSICNKMPYSSVKVNRRFGGTSSGTKSEISKTTARWRQTNCKCQLNFIGLHGVISQKMKSS
jgi:hypothetical protein